MKQALKQSRTWLLISMLAVDGLFFCLTDPDKVPSLFLMVGFLLCAATMYVLLRVIIATSAWYGLPLHRQGRRLAAVLTGTISALVALQSIGALGGRDVVVLLPLTLLAYLYVSYGRNTQSG
ncbi:MAG: hypothetical protein JWL89_463 [Candidatus Saccharibacteria bacterium]|nr:hypothetical protein [Candidatus Saccharibacteria bacterium]